MRSAFLWVLLAAFVFAVGGCGGGDEDEKGNQAGTEQPKAGDEKGRKQAGADKQPAQGKQPAGGQPRKTVKAGPGKSPAPPKPKPGTEPQPEPTPEPPAIAKAKRPVDTAYISDDFIAAVVLRPARVVNSRIVEDFEKAGIPLEKRLEEQTEELGVDPRNVEQVVVLVDPVLIQNAMRAAPMFGPPPRGPGEFKDFDQEFEKKFEEGDFPFDEGFKKDVPEKEIDNGRPKSSADEKDAPQFRVQDSDAEKDAPRFDKKQPSRKFDKQPEFDPEPDFGPPPGFGPAPGGDPFPAMIVRFTEPVDREKVLDMLQKAAPERDRGLKRPAFDKGDKGAFGDEPEPDEAESPGPAAAKPQTRKHAGKSYQVVNGLGAHFPDETTVVVAREELLKEMLAARQVETPLTRQLRGVEADNDFVLVADLLRYRKELKELATIVAEQNAMFAGAAQIPSQLQAVVLTANVTGGPLLTLTLQADDEKSAEQAQTILKGLLGVGQASYMMWSSQAKSNPDQFPKEVRELLPLADQAVSGAKVTTDGTRVVLNVPRPEGFERLPELLKPAIEQAKTAAERMTDRNNLTQIGVAMHNYHDTFGRFPGGATSDGKNHSLSWRVHILPFVDGGALYSQFNLDEPWDSEHNKKLIGEMPDIYKTRGVTDPGKTSLRVFSGKGAPYGGKQPPRMSDITDGSSNTIALVEAGPDKAVIWTKPGGLPFDPGKPKESLGKVRDDFLVLLFDGSVHTLSSQIANDTLKALITPQGGEVVPPDAPRGRFDRPPVGKPARGFDKPPAESPPPAFRDPAFDGARTTPPGEKQKTKD